MKEILCTLGPSTLNERNIQRMGDTGVSLFRLNLSHIDFEDLEEHINLIRKFSSVPICIDTEGAQLRTSKIANGFIDVYEGQIIEVRQDNLTSDFTTLTLNPRNGVHHLRCGDLVSIDFNSVLVQVVEKSNESALLKVLNGGKVGQNKAITVDREIELPPLTEKDLKCVKLAKRMGITHFALSFAGSDNDVKYLRGLIEKNDFLIAKIESSKALKNLDGIINTADAILIDRGDLSREVKIYKIPSAQKYIIKCAKNVNKKVYVATNLLESMLTSSIPTRAEVNDVFNTLEDGADGLVLAAETAIGKHPLMCVEMIKSIICQFESDKEMIRGKFFVEKLLDLNMSNNAIDMNYHFENFPRLKVSDECLLDCYLISNQTFAPLKGPMSKEEIYSVLDYYRLPDGQSWTMPIFLPVENNNFQLGQKVVICDRDNNQKYILEVKTTFDLDLDDFAQRFFGTQSELHPGVKRIKSMTGHFISGEIISINEANQYLNEWIFSPKKLKEIFAFKGWKKIVGFHTRNIPHKGHEYIQNYALKLTQADGLLISPMIGKSRPGDFSSEAVMTCYKELINSKQFPEGRVLLTGFASYPRFAGPREAIFTAICRRNMGCTHFIVGRDHSGLGEFYSDADMAQILKDVGDIGIELVRLEAVGLSTDDKTVHFKSNIDEKNYLPISGSVVRNSILNKSDEVDLFLSGPVLGGIKKMNSMNVEIFSS